MRNVYLRSKTASDIEGRVAKFLRDLGSAEPPVRMEEVIDRLSLDRRYFSSTDEGFLHEAAHKLKVAGKQVFRQPGLLLDAVKQLSLMALFLPDRKRILIDKELPPTKQRWAETHEVAHSVIPWHDQLMLGDTKQTLSPACHQQIEAEANYGAGRLLFLQDRFRDHLDATALTMAHVRDLAKRFGNSITSTLWRAVEHLDGPAVGVISGHPNHPPEDFDPANPCEYLIRSRSFAERFSGTDEATVFAAVRGYCGWVKRGPLGAGEVVLADAAGEEHLFEFETFHNGYQALTLGLYECPRPTTARVGSNLLVATSVRKVRA